MTAIISKIIGFILLLLAGGNGFNVAAELQQDGSAELWKVLATVLPGAFGVGALNIDAVLKWLKDRGGKRDASPSVDRILDAIAVLIRAAGDSVAQQLKELVDYVKKAGFPAWFTFRAGWSDGTVKSLKYGDEPSPKPEPKK